MEHLPIGTVPDLCAHCGGLAETDDHIPPQSLLLSVPRGDRPSVPSCRPCNNGASDDDEYFRDTVAKYHRVAEKAAVAPMIDKMVRAMGNPKKRGYAEATLRSFTDVNAVTHAGIHLGVQPAFLVDAARIERAVGRYVRGLHLLRLGRRVPLDHSIVVRANPEELINRQNKLAEIFSKGHEWVIKDGVFRCHWAVPQDQPTASAWLLTFFDEFPIFAVVHPPGL